MRVDRRLSFVVFVALVLFCANTVIAATIYVSQEKGVAHEATIQAGIDAAADGDIVLVADGTYTGEGNTNLTWNGNEKHITVKSENGPEKCIIDCENKNKVTIYTRGFSFSETNQNRTDVVDGFTIKNGNTDVGGGILCYAASPTITNCIIKENYASFGGGGIFCEDSSPAVTDCIIKENVAEDFGGGIACEDTSVTISDCTIKENETLYAGGGIFCFNSSAVISNCSILGNIVYFNGGGFLKNGAMEEAFGGGGIFCLLSSPTVTDCIIKENVAFLGGGIIIYDSMIFMPAKGGLPIEENLPVTVANCTIEENGAYAGGGITIFSSAMMEIMNKEVTEKGVLPIIESENSLITITDCTVKENEAFFGGGIAALGSMIEIFEFDKRTHDKDVVPIDEITPITITNCAIEENYAGEAGGGIFGYIVPLFITNCTIAENETEGWGGGISCGISLSNVINCTIAENYADEAGGGIDSYTSLMTVKNSILWDNGNTTAKNGNGVGGDEEEIGLYEGSTLTVSYSDVKGGEEGVYVAAGEGCVFNWGEGNIDEAPLFVKAAHNIAAVTGSENIGYHLSKNSPCIDKGTNEGAPADDIDGQKRPFGDTVDMGSDEYVWHGSVNSGNGQVDLYLGVGAFTEFDTIDEEDLPDEGKPELTFPFGFSSFKIIDIEEGGTVDIIVTCSEDVPISAEYWKYDENRDEWYQLPFGSNDGDNIIILTLTDGGEGDEDGEVNGVIIDPGAVGWENVSSGDDDDENRCFLENALGIAKAKEEIMFVRQFRDKHLLTNPLGRVFVSAYYRISPLLAGSVREYPVLRNIAREMLKPIIWITG